MFNSSIWNAAGGAGAPGARDWASVAQIRELSDELVARLASCVASRAEVGLVHTLRALGETIGPGLVGALLGDGRDSLGVAALGSDLLALGPVELAAGP